MAKNELDFEQALKKLKEIVALMENPDTSLEKSVELYKDGVELSKFCDRILNNAQDQVFELSKTAADIFKEEVLDIDE